MRSKAQFKGHPLHPILIAFPIAFLCGALVADIVGRAANLPTVWTTGAYLNLAAIVTGLGAAIPGLVDYLFAVPPHSSAKTRATWHMVINVAALTAFGVAWAFRDLSTLRPGIGALVLEALGVVCVSAGGWLGGVLVFRNQIGVDHRYAAAGKWQEQSIAASAGQTVTVARADELKVNQMKLLHVAGKRIVLARTEDRYAAFDDHCPHRGGPLADGVLACGTVTCPWHGSQFYVRSGAVRSGPTEEPIGTYRVEQVGDEVRLTVP